MAGSLLSRRLAILTCGLCLLTVSGAAAECTPHAVNSFTEPIEKVDVAAREGGIVSRVLVKPGDRVRTGDLLAELDKTIERANVAAAEARADAQGRLNVAEAKQAQAQKKMAEILKLKGSQAVRPLELMQARADLEISKAEVQAAQDDRRDAKLALAQAEARLLLLDIRAPFDGVVDKLYRRESEYVGAGGDPRILSLFNMAKLKADFFLPLECMGNLKRGSNLEVRLVRLKDDFDARVRDIGREIDAPTGLRLVSVEIDNRDYALLGGERVELDLPVGEFGQ